MKVPRDSLLIEDIHQKIALRNPSQETLEKIFKCVDFVYAMYKINPELYGEYGFHTNRVLINAFNWHGSSVRIGLPNIWNDLHTGRVNENQINTYYETAKEYVDD